MGNLSNIEPIMKEYGELRDMTNAAKERMKELDKELRPVLADKGAITGGGYMFELKAYGGRKTLDKAALTADGVDLEAYYKVGAPYTTLTVKKLG